MEEFTESNVNGIIKLITFTYTFLSEHLLGGVGAILFILFVLRPEKTKQFLSELGNLVWGFVGNVMELSKGGSVTRTVNAILEATAFLQGARERTGADVVFLAEFRNGVTNPEAKGKILFSVKTACTQSRYAELSQVFDGYKIRDLGFLQSIATGIEEGSIEGNTENINGKDLRETLQAMGIDYYIGSYVGEWKNRYYFLVFASRNNGFSDVSRSENKKFALQLKAMKNVMRYV